MPKPSIWNDFVSVLGEECNTHAYFQCPYDSTHIVRIPLSNVKAHKCDRCYEHLKLCTLAQSDPRLSRKRKGSPEAVAIPSRSTALTVQKAGTVASATKTGELDDVKARLSEIEGKVAFYDRVLQEVLPSLVPPLYENTYKLQLHSAIEKDVVSQYLAPPSNMPSNTQAKFVPLADYELAKDELLKVKRKLELTTREHELLLQRYDRLEKGAKFKGFIYDEFHKLMALINQIKHVSNDLMDSHSVNSLYKDKVDQLFQNAYKKAQKSSKMVEDFNIGRVPRGYESGESSTTFGAVR